MVYLPIPQGGGGGVGGGGFVDLVFLKAYYLEKYFEAC